MSAQATIDQPNASNEVDLDKLNFVKIKIPENVRLIPKELIESVKGRIFTAEQFYKYQEVQLTYNNAGNLLYVLLDTTKKVHGFLWAEISQIDGSMFVNTFSISRKYWHKGKAMPTVIGFLETLKNKYKCPRVFWITTNDKFFVKHGFKRSKNVLMEYNPN